MINSTLKSSLGLIVTILYVNLAFCQSGQSASHNQTVLSKQEVSKLVDSIQSLISQNFYDKKLSDAINNKLIAGLKQNRYYNLQRDSFIKAINDDLKSVSNDGHLYIQSIEGKEKPTAFEWEAYEKERETQLNFGFTLVEIMEDNYGYIKVVEFMHPKRAMQTAIAAMKFVENTKGLIIDLRGNGGGYPGIMEYILNHYFEGEPIELSKTIYANGQYVTTYTSDLIYGKLRINTPLYILVDKRTASAAEYFAYILQSFKKAVIVGEKSAGAANRNDYFILPDGFRISISVASPVCTLTNTNWEGIGVLPDIKTDNPKEKAIELMKKNTVR